MGMVWGFSKALGDQLALGSCTRRHMQVLLGAMAAAFACAVLVIVWQLCARLILVRRPAEQPAHRRTSL